ncbi:MAG: hypothetical protein PHN78_03000 [Dehalococcoidales bacterium]|nr:hypothetical protein [Dehalococcoidales bacterium]
MEVVCGKGTYIRSIAHDLGQSLGCGASLKSLIRLRYGFFDVRDAVSVAQLEDAFRHGYWQRLIYPLDSVLLDWAAMVVSDDAGRVLRNGCPLGLEDKDSPEGDTCLGQHLRGSSFEERCRAYTPDGDFIGVLHYNPEKKQWLPEKVFHS